MENNEIVSVNQNNTARKKYCKKCYKKEYESQPGELTTLQIVIDENNYLKD